VRRKGGSTNQGRELGKADGRRTEREEKRRIEKANQKKKKDTIVV
jgi:hypothetical protein